MAPSAMNRWTTVTLRRPAGPVLAGRPRQARTPEPALTGAETCDLLVVGGGYSGLWTALIAKERDPGRDVVLMEGREVGWAASGRNGGFCAASLTHGLANGLARWPDEIHKLEELGARNLDAIEAAVARHGLDCDFERTGEIDVATETVPGAGTARLVRGDRPQGPRRRHRVPGRRRGPRPGGLTHLPGGPVRPPGRRHAAPGQTRLGPQAGLPRTSASASTSTPPR